MAKAMLIIDMPSNCEKCPICQGVSMDGEFVCSISDEDGNEQGFYDGRYERPNYCPLKHLPCKRRPNGMVSISDMNKARGFNECIDKILGGGE